MAGFQYFPHTDSDIRAMLDRIGVKSLDDLYADDSLSSDKIMEIYTGIAKAENAATAPIYLELIKVRKEIAQEEGYDSYIDYAYDVIYDRDFTGEDIATLRETIISEIAPGKLSSLTIR